MKKNIYDTILYKKFMRVFNTERVLTNDDKPIRTLSRKFRLDKQEVKLAIGELNDFFPKKKKTRR